MYDEKKIFFFGARQKNIEEEGGGGEWKPKNKSSMACVINILPPLPSLPKTKCLDDGATVLTLPTGQ